MTDEPAFLNRLLNNPTDDVARLVYADWLQEQGDPVSLAKSDFLRTECEATRPGLKRGRRRTFRKRLAELARLLDTGWLAVVSKLPIENCNVRFEFQCPKRWEELRATGEQAVRFCEACGQNVYYCDTIQEARRHARRGECVAVDCAIPRRPNDLLPGLPLLMGKISPRVLQVDEVSLEREQRKHSQNEQTQK